MPYPNEHAARINEPGKYSDIRRENDKFGEGVDVIWGVKENGDTEIQAIRFRSEKFTAAQAREWLKDHDYKPIEFEEATGEKSVAPAFVKGARRVMPVPFEIEGKADDGERYPNGIIRGKASVFGNYDFEGDRFLPGAFSKTIKEGVLGKGIPLMVVHLCQGGSISEVVGIVNRAEETDRHLWMEAPLFSTTAAQEMRKQIVEAKSMGFDFGLSVGYIPLNGKFKANDRGGRDYAEVKMPEITVTPFPMNPQAKVVQAKSLKDMAREIGVDSGALDESRPLSEQVEQTVALCKAIQAALVPGKSEPLAPEVGREHLSGVGLEVRVRSLLRRVRLAQEGV